MNDMTDDLQRISDYCTKAAAGFDAPEVVSARDRLLGACDRLERAWSESWIGYQSCVYKRNFLPREPGDYFDSEWGFESLLDARNRGDWKEFDFEAVENEIIRRAGGDSVIHALKQAGKAGEEAFDAMKGETLPMLEAALTSHGDEFFAKQRDAISELEGKISSSNYIEAIAPRSLRSRDQRAINGGRKCPPHAALQALVLEQMSPADQLKKLGTICKQVIIYAQKRLPKKGRTMEIGNQRGPIFIGHGASDTWKDLKDLLVDRLKLQYEEFNREPQAGRTTKERLAELLEKCTFAFLVMTAEDRTADGRQIARQNVVHEIGLFQGRHGWERAIVLLEDGCPEFSNLHGVVQIRFPKGEIKAKSEEIRGVLEREGYLGQAPLQRRNPQ